MRTKECVSISRAKNAAETRERKPRIWSVCLIEVYTPGDILKHQADALVSPANSFGYMDGGLDLVLSQHFGWDLEKRVRTEILTHHHGELPVGNALTVPTENSVLPWLVCAPTMRVPMRVEGTFNAYLAFRAILIEVRRFNRIEPRIRTLLVPGLGTGEGRRSRLRPSDAGCLQRD